jgi:RsiW-degrading membrane proteinase PrsW (M82 family)
MPTIPVACLDGPGGGQTLTIGHSEVFVANALALWFRDNVVCFATAQGWAIYIDGQPVTRGYLPVGQRFFFNGSNYQVGIMAPKTSAMNYVADHLMRAAGTDKLEGFSLKEMFSEVFKKRKPEEIEDHFLVGTSRTTPPLYEVDTSWPKPWFFFRILAFVGLLYLGFHFAMLEFRNPKLIPGLILMGSFAMPLATLILFFELNTPRNVSFYQALSLFCVGGLVSIFISLIGFNISNLGWLGASSAGIIEEIGKFVTVLIVVRMARYKFILNGMVFGAAVGAGFAAFESAGYAFERLLGNGLEAMNYNILLRGFLAPFGHVAWTAITAGAFFRAKQDKPFNPNLLFHPSFVKAFLIPVVLHMIWNASIIPSPFWIKHLALGVAGWFVVFGLVQQGLRQVREEQQRVTQQRMAVVGGAAA